MAEIAVPILALGAMYIMSNDKNEVKSANSEHNNNAIEGFRNPNQYIDKDELPNTRN